MNAIKFLKSIDFNKQLDIEIESVTLIKSTETFNVHIYSKDFIEPEIVNELLECAKKGINKEKKCIITLRYDEVNENNILKTFNYLLDKMIEKSPSLSTLKEANIKIEDSEIVLDVATKVDVDLIISNKKDIINELGKYGINDIDITSTLNEEKNNKIKDEINSVKESNSVSNKEESPIILGKHVDGALTKIDDIVGEIDNVIVEAYVFNIEAKEFEKTNMFNLMISDNTNSILAKFFVKEKEEFIGISKRIKENSWYRLQGNVKYDNYLKDIALNINNIESIKAKENIVIDEAEEKRVELHAHTMMSAMDSVVDAKKLIKTAYNMGMKAIAVTDHNCVQAFPDVFHVVNDLNKNKEENEHFKVLYGAEMNIVNDDVDIIYQNKDYNLMNQEYVVFDTETTGFYAGSDQMIEIGAVKIKNGEITDRFDELINPNRKLPPKIVELTAITDDMLKDCEDEKTVTKKFLKWANDLPMVAHNAKFDISFMRAACSKYDLGEFNYTVLDTMSMARMLYPSWINHKLSTLVKNLEVPWDEDKHHRGDYDAEGTAIAFYKMCKTLCDRNITTTTKILDEVDMESLVRFARPFHATLLCKNKVGLKNLFKIISIANTKYLYKNDQPKIPRREVEKLRKGLLIGSACINNEVFEKADTLEDEELVNMMNFYDYIEVQPASVFAHLIGPNARFSNVIEAQNHLKKIIRVAESAGKIVVATGDVHNLAKEDLIYRKIIVNQKFNGKLHPLNRNNIEVPNMYLRTTNDMLDEFEFLGEEKAKEIVVTNTNKIADQIEEIEVIINTHGIPFAPKIPNSKEDLTKLVYDKAKELYGDPLPDHIEERIALELYGQGLIDAVKGNTKNKDVYKHLHEVILKGPDSVENEIYLYLKDNNVLLVLILMLFI